MRSLEESRRRWQFTTSLAVSLEDLKRSVRADGDESACKAGLRSVCWKTFLLFESTNHNTWSRALVDSRSAYASLREHLLRYIENPDEIGSALDPLDDDKNFAHFAETHQSPWTTLRQDEEMRAEIFQDVERCMPEEAYFRQPHTQRIMLDILFIFCKINQDVGYRQGMHELLAPILWVVEQDAIDYGDARDQNAGSEVDSLLKQTLDAAYVEHDAFTLLSLIMRSAKSFYELGEPDRRLNTSSTGTGTPQPGASPIVERSKRIHEVYLARLDPDLAKHLTDIEVLPQIFLIRWIRLLFGREFPFEDLLALWDILLAEDSALGLVDMVCVAMLLRIRWQLIDASYSFALMLLLKYPSPAPPHGPQTFVDDAIYLRDNFSAVGGNNIISKYSGRPVPAQSSGSRPLTPLGPLSPTKKLSRAMSPLPSPARFLQQQGGIEGLLQGATKGVLDRGERLGINQAVRDAVGEVKKNMQGLQNSRGSSTTRGSPDVVRWSLDEGRSVHSSQASVSAIKNRNLHLARMLDQAMTDLRAVSVSEDGDKDKYIKAIDLAIAKVDFVKVYLEDSTMPLPSESSHVPTAAVSPVAAASPQHRPHDPSRTTSTNLSSTPAPEIGTKDAPLPAADLPKAPNLNPEALSSKQSRNVNSQPEAAPSVASQMTTVEIEADAGHLARPTAPVPSRSSIAQSSFSWMLEPDSASATSGLKSSPPKSTSPFLKSGRRPNSGSSREKAAFLFGEDGGESKMASTRLASVGDAEEAFDLGTMQGGKDKSWT